MGPLTKLRSIIDGELNSIEGKVEFTIEDLNELVEQSITMQGQALNTVPYNRHIQALFTLLNDNQAKHFIKDKV